MQALPFRRIRIKHCLGLVLALCGAFVAPTLSRASGGGPMTLSVLPGGGLTIDIAGGASATALRVVAPSSAEMSRIFLPFPAYTARDLTGTGGGWHVTVQSTPVRSDAGAQLPEGSLRMAAPIISCAPTISCAGRASPPSVVGIYPAAIDVDGAVTVASAARNTGMGTYRFSPGSFDGGGQDNLLLATPPSSRSEEYSSNLMISMVSGP